MAQLVDAPSRGSAALGTRGVLDRMRSYLLLTKPRVIELLLITTVPAMILADGGIPPLSLVTAVLAGGAMAAGGANAINCWLERDRDRLMRRTHGRPLPAGEIAPGHALAFAILLEVLAFGVLWGFANLLAALLALGATVFYVFVYTIWLKPRTAQNIVIGGAAGAVPVLVGWAAVTGSLSAAAGVLFAVIFLWTPPHFWALSVRYADDYERAGIPMLPVVRGAQHAANQIAVYSVLVAATSLLLPVVSEAGWLYTALAAVLGAGFVVGAMRLRARPTPARAVRLFTLSNIYLGLLFAAVAADVLIVAR